MMELAESLFEHLALKVLGTTEIEYQGHTISLKAPFARLHMVDGIKRTTGSIFSKSPIWTKLGLAKEHGIAVPNHQKAVGHIINLFFEKYVEARLFNRPLFTVIRSKFRRSPKECPGSAFYRSV